MNCNIPGRLCALIAAFMVVLVAGSVMAETKSLNGTVAYRERIALPPSAVLEVELVDVSLADAPAIRLAYTRIEPVGQVPIPYTLWFDEADIQSSHRYAVQARILVDDRLWFATTTQHRVFGEGETAAHIIVTRIMANDINDGARRLAGNWAVEDIDGRGVAEEPKATLEITEDGAVGGSGGCNRMAGQATISDGNISFGALAATQMACLPAVMDQEARFFNALEKVRTWRIDEAGDRLVLLDENEAPLVTLRRL